MVEKAFADHPQTPERILHSQEEIARILPARDEYTVTTSEFDDIKARLARIENKRRLTDTKGAPKPSLRRSGTSTGDPTGSSGTGGNTGAEAARPPRTTARDSAQARRPELGEYAPSVSIAQRLGPGCMSGPTSGVCRRKRCMCPSGFAGEKPMNSCNSLKT